MQKPQFFLVVLDTMYEKLNSDGKHHPKVTGIGPVTPTASLFKNHRWQAFARHLSDAIGDGLHYRTVTFPVD